MSMDAVRREIARLRVKLAQDDKDFAQGAPPLDEDGLPIWDGESLSIESYVRALGVEPSEELTDAERAARQRLAPYASVFAEMDDPMRAGGEAVR